MGGRSSPEDEDLAMGGGDDWPSGGARKEGRGSSRRERGECRGKRGNLGRMGRAAARLQPRYEAQQRTGSSCWLLPPRRHTCD